MTKQVSFPGLGLDFNINPTAFTLFGIDIQWYGIILATGILAAFCLFYQNAVKKEQLDGDSILNATLLIVPISIVGARFFYVITSWDKFKDGSFIDMINIRAGGIAIYGAIIFGLITVLIYNWVKKTNPLTMLDALAPAVMLGQIIGRWGNFMNAEAYGWTEGVENLPWRMWLERVYIDGVYQPDLHFVHPTFLYESLWNLIGLTIIMLVLYRKKKFDGEIFCAYTAWYGLGRTFIEMLRTDSLYIVGNLKFSVFVGIVAFVAGVSLAFVFYKISKKVKAELDEYTPAYTTASINAPDDSDDEAESLDNLEENDEDVLAEQDMLDGDDTDITEE